MRMNVEERGMRKTENKVITDGVRGGERGNFLSYLGLARVIYRL